VGASSANSFGAGSCPILEHPAPGSVLKRSMVGGLHAVLPTVPFWNGGASPLGRSAIFLYNTPMIRKKMLLINCYREEAEKKISGYRDWLRAGAVAAGLELTVRDVRDAGPFPGAKDFDAVVVSGSQKMVAAGEVETGLLEFLKYNRRPLLGICYGHQVLAAAFGAIVKKDAVKHLGDEDVRLLGRHELFAHLPPVFKMRESHEEIVMRGRELEKSFSLQAENGSGLVEAIVHRMVPLYGVQFHPEKSGEPGIRLLGNFLKLI